MFIFNKDEHLFYVLDVFYESFEQNTGISDSDDVKCNFKEKNADATQR